MRRPRRISPRTLCCDIALLKSRLPRHARFRQQDDQRGDQGCVWRHQPVAFRDGSPHSIAAPLRAPLMERTAHGPCLPHTRHLAGYLAPPSCTSSLSLHCFNARFKRGWLFNCQVRLPPTCPTTLTTHTTMDRPHRPVISATFDIGLRPPPHPRTPWHFPARLCFHPPHPHHSHHSSTLTCLSLQDACCSALETSRIHLRSLASEELGASMWGTDTESAVMADMRSVVVASEPAVCMHCAVDSIPDDGLALVADDDAV